MKQLLWLIAGVAMMSAGGAYAASDTAAASGKTKQQTRMATCNKTAKEKQVKGIERRQFMSACLKG